MNCLSGYAIFIVIAICQCYERDPGSMMLYFKVIFNFFFQIKLWQIPETGLRGNLTEWLLDLHGHTRRVGYIEWHPTAENILLSAGYDFKVIVQRKKF